MCARNVEFCLLVREFSENDWMVLGVVCDECSYEVLAPDDAERERLLEARRLWDQNETGDLADEAAAQALVDLRSTTLARIIEDARTWRCPQCREDVPRHFGACWSCGYERELFPEEISLEQADESPEQA